MTWKGLSTFRLVPIMGLVTGCSGIEDFSLLQNGPGMIEHDRLWPCEVDVTDRQPQVLPKEDWTLIHVDSEVEPEYAGVHAIDGDPTTIWHSMWWGANQALPHEIQIDLGSEWNVSELRYLPRQDQNLNGTILEYMVFATQTKDNWGSPVAVGRFEGDGTQKSVLFETRRARYVRLVAVSSLAGASYASAAEIDVLGLPVLAEAIDKKHWTVCFADSDTTEHPAVHAIDGDADTHWESGDGESDHEIQLDLGVEYELTEIRYQLRRNGWWLTGRGSFDVYASSNLDDWGVPVATGRLKGAHKQHRVMFAPTRGRYVRFVVRPAPQSAHLGWCWPKRTVRLAELDLVGSAVPMPKDDWVTVYTDSQAMPTHAAELAFDNDPQTMWYTHWRGDEIGLPHEIQIDLGAEWDLREFSYLPRQDGNDNGDIGDFSLYVGETTDAWGKPVATGTFSRNKREKRVAFASSRGRYVRLVAASAIAGGDTINAAELGLVGMPAVGEKVPHIVTVDASEQGRRWEGFGTSLAWWANGVGNSSYDELYADLLFTMEDVEVRGQRLPGLGMNIVRYNVGGGGRPGDRTDVQEQWPESIPWYKDMEGFWIDGVDSDPHSSSWDWSRDSNQRRMLQLALQRDVTYVDLFSVAPMWWMTSHNSTAGGSLKPEFERDFARYLATVASQARSQWGVRVRTVEPFNEPSSYWWTYPSMQEGCTIPKEQQTNVLGYLREELDAAGLRNVGIAASDENSMEWAVATYQYFKNTTIDTADGPMVVADLIDKLNVHAYYGLNPYRDNRMRQFLRHTAGGKPIWQSEFGTNDPTGMDQARTIVEDINYLGVNAWVYWQAISAWSAWGLVNASYQDGPDMETRGKPTWTYYAYYVMAQFTRFIRPGMRILATSDSNTVAAYDRRQGKLVFVTIVLDDPKDIAYDLAQFRLQEPKATVTVTNANGRQLFRRHALSVDNEVARIHAEPRSVYSVEIQGARWRRCHVECRSLTEQ